MNDTRSDSRNSNESPSDDFTAADYDRIVCPECGEELPADLAREPVKICPRCQANISNTYEVLIRPAARSPWARRIAWVIIIGFAIVMILALAAIY